MNTRGKGKGEGVPPNNWESFFSEPAWNYYPEVGEWALHLFSRKQMDLNWENPALREEIYDMLNWWMDKGVDGFRLDVIRSLTVCRTGRKAPSPELNSTCMGRICTNICGK